MPERDRTARHRGYCSLGWTKRRRERTRLKEVTEPELQQRKREMKRSSVRRDRKNNDKRVR